MKLSKPNLPHRLSTKRRPVKLVNDNLYTYTDHCNTTRLKTTTTWFLLISTLLILYVVNLNAVADPQLPEELLPLITSIISTPGVQDSGLGASLVVSHVFNN